MTTWTQEQGRLMRAARALKAYFEHKLQTSMEFLAEAPSPLGDGDVQFSTSMSQHGLWGVRSGQPLKADQHSEIYQMFHSVLGAIDVMEQRREDLSRMQHKMEQAMEEIPSNVIPLRRGTSIPARTPVNHRRWILKLDCLIEAVYVTEIHKMAMELHSHSRRYAFLHHRDLSPEQRRSVTELLSLGSVSLFIPDLMSLPPEEQTTLFELIQVETVQRPLLMVGTTVPYSELRRVDGVHIELLASLARAYIKLTKPFSDYKDQNLIHYFLDSLSENPS